MSAETYTATSVKALRHTHIGRPIHVTDHDALSDFGLDEIAGVIEGFAVYADGVTVNIDYWDEDDDGRPVIVCIDLEFDLDGLVNLGPRLGGAS